MYANWIDFPHLFKKHRYYMRSGFYLFLAKNVLKVAVILMVVIAVFYGIEKYIIDLDVLFNSAFKNMHFGFVYLIFTISESLFGLIPPDLFILWARRFSNPWLVVSILAILSYLGGIISYYIGSRIRQIKKLNKYLSDKFKLHFRKIKRWGSVFIVVAAMFPLPYSTICIISGILEYPFRNFVLLGFVRILRFYIYALVLFGLIKL